MVKKRQTKRQRDIKTKLMAAICMLLVSSIMMVSTTYAWFTLSTAPEVTGITTAVGANGNLEMALLPTDGQLTSITTGNADSVKGDLERNITWGNLVDVSDPAYGLDQITLYPSELNIGDDGKLPVTGSLLKTPAYGADGRVSELLANTLTSGTFNTTSSSFTPDGVFGVRAVGTASGMTDRQLSYRNARAAANTAVSQATKAASDSLSVNGGDLANIAIKKGTGKTDDFTQEDLAALETIISDLETKVLPKIETAYMQYILAYAASAKTGDTDTAWLGVKALVDAPDATLATVKAGLAGAGVTLPDALNTAIADYEAIVTAVADARGKLNTLKINNPDGPYTWTELSPILTALADPDQMQVNGIPAGAIMDDDNMNKLFNSVAGGNGLIVTMASGGGVYADIADQCGDFTAGVKIEKVEHGGLEVGPLDAKMNTKTSMTTPYLGLVGAAVETAGAPKSGEAGEVPITDMFGYVIDMAFRTNASDSNLLLQPTGVDRIYSTNQNGVEVEHGKDAEGNPTYETTMGGGAYMQFVSTTNSFGNDKVANLMEAIRIVFFNPDSGEIIAYGKLDVDNAENTADGGLKAKIVLYTVTDGVSYAPATGAEATHVEVKTPSYVETSEGATHISDGAGGYTDVIPDGQTATHKEVITTTYELKGDREGTHKEVASGTEVIKTDNVIMPLNQNEATKLSVLVYLDGNKVTNADVAAVGATSVTGTMNLQFSSSATLIPMNYTPLMEQGGTTYKVTPSVAAGVTNLNANASAGKDYTFTVADGYTLGEIKVGSTVLVTGDYTVAADGKTVTIPAAKVTGDITITVTAN